MIVVGISIVGMNMMIPEMMLIMIDEDEITSKSQYQVPIGKLKFNNKMLSESPTPPPPYYLYLRVIINLWVTKKIPKLS